MKAWKIQSDRSLQLSDMALIPVAPDEVRIQVKAVGVNRADILQIKGLYPAPFGFDSSIPGLEYAGIVEAIGSRVSQRQVGDRVMGLIPSGCYSEIVQTHALETLLIPDGMDFLSASTIPEAFLTAYRALFIEGDLQAGQWCLVRPASSAVGLAAVQLANAVGARVIGSSRQLSNLQTAQAMGLAELVVEDENLAQGLLDITDGEGVAFLLDMLGSQWQSVFGALRTEAIVVLLGILAASKTELDLMTLLTRRLTLRAMTMRNQPVEQRIIMAKLFAEHMAPLFTNGRLQPLPYESFAFSDVADAHQHMVHNRFSGKRVLLL